MSYMLYRVLQFFYRLEQHNSSNSFDKIYDLHWSVDGVVQGVMCIIRVVRSTIQWSRFHFTINSSDVTRLR